MNSSEVTKFFRKIKVEVKNEIGLLANSPKSYYGVLREVFCKVEFLASLTCLGEVELIEKYFGEVYPLYKKFPSFIFIVMRHGTVHGNVPKVVDLGLPNFFCGTVVGRGKKLREFIYDGVVFTHLTPKDSLIHGEFWDSVNKSYYFGRFRNLWFPISTRSLYHDLLKAVDLIILDLEKGVIDPNCVSKGIDKALRREDLRKRPEFRKEEFKDLLTYCESDILTNKSS